MDSDESGSPTGDCMVQVFVLGRESPSRATYTDGDKKYSFPLQLDLKPGPIGTGQPLIHHATTDHKLFLTVNWSWLIFINIGKRPNP